MRILIFIISLIFSSNSFAQSPEEDLLELYEETCLSYMGDLDELNEVLSRIGIFKQGSGKAAETLLFMDKGKVWLNSTGVFTVGESGTCSFTTRSVDPEKLESLLVEKYALKLVDIDEYESETDKKFNFYELTRPIAQKSDPILIRFNAKKFNTTEVISVPKKIYEQDKAKTKWYNSKLYWFRYAGT